MFCNNKVRLKELQLSSPPAYSLGQASRSMIV